MSTVNLYDVLNVSNDCSSRELKSAYRELVLEFHPDQPGGDAEMFELVTHAYNVLKNPKTRAEYDELYKLSKQSESDHFNLKHQADVYLKAQNTTVVKKSKEDQEKDFQKAMAEMDRKRRYNRNRDDKTINLKDANRMMRDLETIREQEDIENIHEQIFEDGRFDINKFNEAFDAMHKGPMDMVPHSGNPDAWNTIDGFESNFSNIDNYDDIFVDDEIAGQGTFYSSVDFDSRDKKKKLTKEDVAKMKGANYTHGHNVIDDDYEKMLEERLRERKQESSKYDDRDYGDFDTDPTCGGYGIFSDLGMTNMSNLTWDNDDDVQKRYQRLLELRKKDIK